MNAQEITDLSKAEALEICAKTGENYAICFNRCWQINKAQVKRENARRFGQFNSAKAR